MSGSLIDMLAPEARDALGVAAVGVVVLGAVIWAAGLKVARILIAVLVGFAGAAIAAATLPGILGVAMLTAALVGFAVGALAGALGFRLLQGLTLAVCLGLAVAGSYYRWHVQAPISSTTARAVIAADQPQSVPASDLLVKGPLADQPATSEATNIAKTTVAKGSVLARKLLEVWTAIDRKDQRRILAAGIGTAVVVLLLAFGFARQTTLIVSAILGTLMMLGGADAGTHILIPSWNHPFPPGTWLRIGIIAALALAGMLIQWWLFWPRKKTSAARAPAPERRRTQPPPPAWAAREAMRAEEQ